MKKQLRYEAIPALSKEEIEAAVGRDNPHELSVAVLSAVLESEDRAWAESLCERLAHHADANVRGNAVLGFGHLARLHGSLAERQVKPLIEAALMDDDAYVRGQAQSAADDVEMFLHWKIMRQRA